MCGLLAGRSEEYTKVVLDSNGFLLFIKADSWFKSLLFCVKEIGSPVRKYVTQTATGVNPVMQSHLSDHEFIPRPQLIKLIDHNCPSDILEF